MRGGPAVWCLSAILAANAPLGAATAPADPGFGERLDVDVVDVEVYVTDAEGRPVDGLERGDFTLREDGRPMEITNFAAIAEGAGKAGARSAATSGTVGTVGTVGTAGEPLHLVVFIDNTQIAAGHRNRALRQIRDFLSRRLAAGDAVMLATHDPGLHVRLPFTSDRDAVERALAAVETTTAANGAGERARRFALDQILDIQERSAMAQTKQQKRAGGGGARRPDDATEDAGSPESDTACPPEIAQPVKSYAEDARQQVLRSINGLNVLVGSLSGLSGRKAVLYVSDGLPVTPGEDLFQLLAGLCADAPLLGTLTYHGMQAMLDAQAYSTVRKWEETAARASAQRVTLYTLQATGLESRAAAAADMGPAERALQSAGLDRIERENRRSSLTALATGTGGRAVFDANDLAADMGRIEGDLGHYYSLGYTPPHSGDGRDHRIAVAVRRPGVRVRSRQVYRDKPPLERAVDRTLASLYQGYEDNPLDVQVEVGAPLPASPRTWTLPLRLRIPLFKIAMATGELAFQGRVRLLLATDSAAGGRSPVRQVDVPISIPREKALIALGQLYEYDVKLTVEPGEQRVAIAVRDEATTLTSYFARTVQVGAAAPGSTQR